MDQRNVDVFNNGMIVSDSEVEDPEDYVDENREKLKNGTGKMPKIN